MNVGFGHIAVVPVVLPLVLGAFMLVIDEHRVALKGTIGLLGALATVATATALVHATDSSATLVYRIGNWPAPFGIVLVADRLSAAMVLLASIVSTCALTFSLARWDRAGPRFHALFQFLLMGVNGAFLTGDLFNLFVFFEVLLAASYGLALHGSGTPRVTASLHYISINLTASLLFLLGASLLYGVTGTLNMADMARRTAQIAAADRALLEAGAAILGIAFLVKAGMWPLCFWLSATYSAASAPVAAVFAILTKVGVYSVLRVWLLVFGSAAGESAGFGSDWLVVGGLATLAFGMIGLLASRDVPRLASYSLLVSAGTLLAAIGFDQAALTGAALYYLIVSTLGVSALFLLGELVQRGRGPADALLAASAEYFGDGHVESVTTEEVGVAIPAAMALLGLSFAGSALVIAGLPPFAGFFAKLAMVSALLAPDRIGAWQWGMIALLMAGGLAGVVAIGREGMRLFWAAEPQTVPHVGVLEMIPIAVLLALCGFLTIKAGPVMGYLDAAARDLHGPEAYIRPVLE